MQIEINESKAEKSFLFKFFMNKDNEEEENLMQKIKSLLFFMNFEIKKSSIEKINEENKLIYKEIYEAKKCEKYYQYLKEHRKYKIIIELNLEMQER